MKTKRSLIALATALAAPALANPIDLIRPDAPELAAYGPLPIGGSSHVHVEAIGITEYRLRTGGLLSGEKGLIIYLTWD